MAKLRHFLKGGFCIALLFLVTLLLGSRSYAQIKPYHPENLAVLEEKLRQTEIKPEKAAILLDLHDQCKYTNSRKAYGYNNQALYLSEQIRNKALMARAFTNKGSECFYSGELNTALKFYLKSCKLISAEEEPLQMALNLSGMANIFSLKGDYPTSMEYSYRSIEISKKSPVGLNLRCHARANLAGTYISLEQYKKAEYLLKRNLNELKDFSSPTVKALTYTNLGSYYANVGKIKTAIYNQKLALEETEPLGLNYFTARACSSLSNLYLSDNQPDKGLLFARRAKLLSTISQDAQIQTIASANIAWIFLSLNKLDSARFYSQYALSLSKSKGIHSFQPWILQIHSEVLKELGLYNASLEALQESRKISKHIITEEAKNQSVNRLEAFSALETREDLDLKYAHQLVRITFFRNISIVVVVLALIIGIGIFFLYRHRNMLSNVLKRKYEEIETKRKEVSHLNQIKDQLFAAIAQELRTPLQTIQDVLANLDQNARPGVYLSEPFMLNQLQHQTVRTITIMEDLLFTARVQMQMYQPLRQEFQLKSLTDELDKNLKLLNNGTFLTIIHAIPKDLYLYSDMTMLKMALRNLFLNVAYRPGKIMFPVVLSAWKENGLVNIRIADVQEFEQSVIKCNDQQCNDSPHKPYWDISLIQNFLEADGGKLLTCPGGKGYDIVLPDPHQS